MAVLKLPSASADERKQANCRVVHSAGKAKKSTLPLCRVAPGITTIWWWTDRSRFWQESNSGESEYDKKE